MSFIIGTTHQQLAALVQKHHQHLQYAKVAADSCRLGQMSIVTSVFLIMLALVGCSEGDR